MPDHEGFYLAEPSGQGRAGVMVVHDWYGLLPHVRTACDELAAAGLVAVAPDLYGGRATIDPEQAEAFMEAMDTAKARARLDAATADLRERTGGGPVGGAVGRGRPPLACPGPGDGGGAACHRAHRAFLALDEQAAGQVAHLILGAGDPGFPGCFGSKA